MNFIGEYFIDEQVCSEVIDYFHSVDAPYKKVAKSYFRNTTTNEWESIENNNIKKCTEIGVNVAGSELFAKHFAVEVNEVLERYLGELQKCADEYVKEFKYCNTGSPWTIVEPFNIQHYKPGEGYYAWHTERNSSTFPSVARHLVFMTYLNTVTDKGGTEFYYQKLTTDAVVGKTLIWPSDWTHTHRGVPSPTQEKTIATGWFSYYQ
jgi:hypothetical protein